MPSCNGGTMRITIVLLLVALCASTARAECVGDANDDGAVSLGELQQCVNSLLGACGPSYTPPQTPTPTPTPATSTCLLPKTGQTASYHDGDDGDLQLGVAAQFT